MTAADLFIKCLEAEGVEYIFGVAGEENLHLVEVIRKSDIKYVPVRHEQSAGFIAATFGRLTGKIGVALSTLGPGALNLVTAIAYADLGAMPSLFITGQKPIKNNVQGNFQIVDIVRMLEPIVKRTTAITEVNKIPSTIRRFVKAAQEERPGPVHIEIAKDLLLDQTEKQPLAKDYFIRRPIAERKAITKAVELIKKAKAPLLLIGASANRKSTSKILTEFVNESGIYFVDTQMGKGVVDETHPQFIGTASLSRNDLVHQAISQADLIINVGHDTIEKSPFVMNENSQQQVIHINYFSAEIHEFYFPQLEVIGDIANAIWQIKEEMEKQAVSFKQNHHFETVKKEIEIKIYQKAADWKTVTDKLLARHIVGVVRDFMESDDILTLDNGMYKLWFSSFYKANSMNSILLDNALATMGAGLPSGIATKILNPDKKVLVVAGDGGFMMNSQELETAVRLKLDLVILLINDNGLGMIKWEQTDKNYDRFGLDHGNPNFIKYAESYGAHGQRVTTPQELLAALEKAYQDKGVQLIEAVVDYSENKEYFSKH